eukprot:5384000-Pleurochrysis_carterae.AAC.5
MQGEGKAGDQRRRGKREGEQGEGKWSCAATRSKQIGQGRKPQVLAVLTVTLVPSVQVKGMGG